MSNAKDCAFPTYAMPYEEGLTKREYFAALAMQGLIARTEIWPSMTQAVAAVEAADALLAALEAPRG